MTDMDQSALSQIERVTGYRPETIEMSSAGEAREASTSALPERGGLRRRGADGASRLQRMPGSFTSVVTGEAIEAPDIDDAANIMERHRYLGEVVKKVRKAMAYPNEPMDASVARELVNFAAQLLTPTSAIAMNMVASTVYLRTGSESTREALLAKGSYAMVGVLTGTLWPEVVAFGKRKAGGTDTTLLIKRSDESAEGAYSAAFGAAFKSLVQTWLYGAVTTGVYAGSGLTGLSRSALATMSGVAASGIAGQSLNMGVVSDSLSRVGARSHDDLDSRRNNHDQRVAWLSGINRRPPAAFERTTPREKMIEVGLTGLVEVTRQAVIFGMQAGNPFNALTNPASYQAYTVFASFTVGSLAALAARAAVLKLRSDPIEHRRDFNVIANNLLCDRLEASRLRNYSNTLDAVANDLNGPALPEGFYESEDAAQQDRRAREVFAAAKKLLRPDAENLHAGRDNAEDLATLRRFFVELRDQYVERHEEVSGLGARSEGSLSKAAELLQFICRDLENLQDASSGSGAAAPYGTYYTDMLQRTYDLGAMTYQAAMLDEAQDLPEERKAVETLMTRLIPVLAGVQKGERLWAAQDVVATLNNLTFMRETSGVGEPGVLAGIYSSLGMSAQDEAHGQILNMLTRDLDNVFGTDLFEVIEENNAANVEAERTEYIRQTLTSLEQLTGSGKAQTARNAAARMQLLILQGWLRRQYGLVPDDDTDADPIIAALHRFPLMDLPGTYRADDDQPGADGRPAASGNDAFGLLLDDIAGGLIDVRKLALALESPDPADVLADAEAGSMERGEPVPAADEHERIRAEIGRLKMIAGASGLAVLQGEAGIGALKASSGEVALNNIAEDIESMNHIVRTMLTTALAIGQVPGAVNLDIVPQKDGHAHFDNFNMLDVALENLTETGRYVAVLEFLLMSIPNVVDRGTDRVKYYGVNPYPSHYRDGDGSAIRQRADQQGHVISMTGFAEYEGVLNQYQKHLRYKMKNDRYHSAGWIGETSDLKYTLTDAMLDNVAHITAHAEHIMVPNALHGFGKTGHHDIGGPHGKVAYGDVVVAALREAKRLLRVKGDPMHGGPLTPPPKLVHVIPHFGISPQNSGGSKLTEFWDRTFRDEELTENLFVDTSWKVTVKAIVLNLRDQIRPVSPLISASLEHWGVMYDALSDKVGKMADKYTDLNSKKQRTSKEASLHYAASEGVAGAVALSIANIQKLVRMEMKRHPAVRQQVADMARHRDDRTGRWKGNNWLNLFFEHSGRMMFGSDMLGTEVLKHGQAIVMADILQLHPVYGLFMALVSTDEDPENSEFAQVVPNVARNTFDQVVRNEELAARREYAHRYLSDVKPSDGKRALGNVVRYVNQASPALQAEFASLNTQVQGLLVDRPPGEELPSDVMVSYLTEELLGLIDVRPIDPETAGDAANPRDAETMLERREIERRRQRAEQLSATFRGQVAVAVTSAIVALGSQNGQPAVRDWSRERTYRFLTDQAWQVIQREDIGQALGQLMRDNGWDDQRISRYVQNWLDDIGEEAEDVQRQPPRAAAE